MVYVKVIDTTKQISDLVDWLHFRHAPPEPMEPTMYIDLEGVKLSRNGSLSILTLLVDTGIPTMSIYIIDVHTLGTQAFTTSGIERTNLKDILQNERIPKVFFDVRNDSDILFAHFGVKLQGVQDIQLMESATRTTTGSRKYLSSLVKCVADLGHNTASWKLAKETGERLFRSEYGGSYQVFNQRPIPKQIVSYCVGDVQCLPQLWNSLQRQKARLNVWRDLVCEETRKRVTASQKPEYQPHGANRALAPWSEAQNKILDEWNEPIRLDDYYDEDRDWDDAYEQHFNSDDDDDWGPESCRDIISSWDYDCYYSD